MINKDIQYLYRAFVLQNCSETSPTSCHLSSFSHILCKPDCAKKPEIRRTTTEHLSVQLSALNPTHGLCRQVDEMSR